MKQGALRRVGVFSVGVARLPRLKALVGYEKLVLRPTAAQARRLDGVIGWGHKPTAERARDYAREHGVPYLALEDGFLRSVGLGKQPPLSLVVDDEGIYYDARTPSRLERLLSEPIEEVELLARARRCRERIVESGLSKYNHAPDHLPPELERGEPYVVVADQTYGDASIELGLADASTFEAMLESALSEHPDARIVAKVHPDTISGKKRGHLAQLAARARVTLLASDVSPGALLRRARQVYVCTSQLGFEALLYGVKVSCFGLPFYAGWGLTDDRLACERRGKQRTLDELVAAALLLYPRYVDPLTGKRCQAEDTIEHLALQRRLLAENRRHFVCFGFSYWKRPFVRRYLEAPGHAVTFLRSPERAASRLPADATGVVWASRSTPALRDWARERNLPLWNMEDGFLRSVGLGSDLTAPGSLVLDREGIYYDPRTPSELEMLLQAGAFTPRELERAAHLRQRIIESGVSKYNAVSGRRWRPLAAEGRRVVLVPGQVEDDASVRYGGSGSIRDNKSLLRAVRAACPGAYLVYKPHPDVLSGNRSGAITQDGEKLWDELLERASIADCLAVVHEVHTITSLVGFEALLRGLPVTTYGQPFYAGWGLTSDRNPPSRRTRRLTLDELVAGALLRYPRYFSFTSRAFCTAEEKVWELEQRAKQRRSRVPLPRLAKKLVSLSVSALEWARAR